MPRKFIIAADVALVLAGIAVFLGATGRWAPGIFAGIVLGVAGIAVLAYGVFARGLTVRLARETVQRHLDAGLPIKGSAVGVGYELPRATVRFRPDARIEIDADVVASALGRSAKVNLVGSGVLLYRDGAFYLTAFRVEDASAKAVEPAVSQPAEEAAQEAGWSLGSLVDAVSLKGHAGKLLEGVGRGGAFAFLSAKADAVTDFAKEKGGALLAEALDRIPVHRLDDADRKEHLAKLVLGDVRVEGERLVVRLDPSNLLP